MVAARILFFSGVPPLGSGRCGIGAPCNASHGVAPSVQTPMFHYGVRIPVTRGLPPLTLLHHPFNCAPLSRGSPLNILKRHAPCNTAQLYLQKIYIRSPRTDGDSGRRYPFCQPRPARNKATPNKFVMAFSVGVTVLKKRCFDPNGVSVICAVLCTERKRCGFGFFCPYPSGK